LCASQRQVFLKLVWFPKEYIKKEEPTRKKYSKMDWMRTILEGSKSQEKTPGKEEKRREEKKQPPGFGVENS